MLALDYLGAGSESVVLNCGCGRGYSVLEVVEAVKRVSGGGFETRFASRRTGDPATLRVPSMRLQPRP
jgi:UDP-glucose 4-epimerase